MCLNIIYIGTFHIFNKPVKEVLLFITSDEELKLEKSSNMLKVIAKLEKCC